MKRRLVLFVVGVLASLAILPALNLRDLKPSEYMADPTVLYYMDPLQGLISRLLVPLGISIDLGEIIVGRDGWLHLGDVHADTLSISMTPATEKNHQTIAKMAATYSAWNTMLAERGVKLFRVMIAPNKSTIYPETLPDWAQPADKNGSDLIFGSDTAPYVIDLRPALIKAKAAETDPIYYPLDSHWNILAARAAFDAFAQNVAKDSPDLIWPDATMLARAQDGSVVAADLRAFLKLPPSEAGRDPRLAVEDWDLPIEIVNTSTGEVQVAEGNARVPFSMTPEIIRSPKSLNHRKVLWLRDSFGGALSPMMAATFSEVMAVHWSTGLLPTEAFMRMVDDFKPDYVFVTVVERDARAEAFTTLPHIRPTFPTTGFTPLHESLPESANDISPGTEPGELVVQGSDPFLVFSIPGGFPADQARFLALAVSCKDGTDHVPIQFFWASDRSPNFYEAHSQKLTATAAPQVIDLGSIPLLQDAGRLTHLRLDLNAQGHCNRFMVAFPVFGSMALSNGVSPP